MVETPFFDEESHPDLSAYDQHCKGRRYALFFGRMTQMKGVHVLADALPSVLQQCPDLSIVLVGRDGSAPDGQSMRDYVRGKLAAFADRVLLLDQMRHDQLYPIIQGARLVVLPSLVDNLPNSCLESMGLGKVVIATTGSCFEQLISDGYSGVLVPPDDPERLAEAMVRTWALGDDETKRIGDRARERIGKLHPDTTIPQLVAYYQEIVRDHAAKRAG